VLRFAKASRSHRPPSLEKERNSSDRPQWGLYGPELPPGLDQVGIFVRGVGPRGGDVVTPQPSAPAITHSGATVAVGLWGNPSTIRSLSTGVEDGEGRPPPASVLPTGAGRRSECDARGRG